MRYPTILMATVVALSFLLVSDSFAQPRGLRWRGGGGWGPGNAYNKLYDPKTVETVSGEVESVDRIVPRKGMSYGVHLNMKTDKGETVSVHLGPSWYIENQDVKIQPKDKIDVKGSKITFGGKPTIIAAEVKKGDEVLKLRDENGFPAWSGWRKGS